MEKFDKVKDKVKGKVKSAFESKDLERKNEGKKPPENMAVSITRGFENVAREEQEARRQSASGSSNKGSTWEMRFTGDSKGLLDKSGAERGEQGHEERRGSGGA